MLVMLRLQLTVYQRVDFTGYVAQITTMAENPISKAAEGVQKAAKVCYSNTCHIGCIVLRLHTMLISHAGFWEGDR